MLTSRAHAGEETLSFRVGKGFLHLRVDLHYSAARDRLKRTNPSKDGEEEDP